MTPLQFARLWLAEKDLLLSTFLDADSNAAVATSLRGLGLSPEQTRGLRPALDAALSDTMYKLLLGLDGAASIGGRQEVYRLFSEGGAQLSGDGELEAAAWEVFHGPTGDTA